MQPDQNIADDRSLSRYFPDEDPGQNLSGTQDATDDGEIGTPEGGQGGGGGGGSSRGGRLLRIEAGSEPGSIKIIPIDIKKIEVGMLFEAEFAYALRGGDSFSAWDPEDFNIANLINNSESKGAGTRFADNKVFIEVIKKDFELVFSDFDINRDLSIELKRAR